MNWKIVLKVISLILLWGVVAVMIVYVDPKLLKDVWFSELYAPFLLAVFTATAYTMSLITRSGVIGIIEAGLVVLGLILLLLQVFNYLIAVAIVGSILAMSYFAIKKNRSDTLLRRPKVDNL